MSVDLSEFHALASGKTKKPCPVALALQALAPAERKQLEEALLQSDKAAPGYIGPGAIVKWIERRLPDLRANPNHVYVHRDRRCRCHD